MLLLVAAGVLPRPADPRRFLAFLESLSYADYSMAIKAGVHFTLCGGTVAKLGTAKHHNSILPKLNTLELTGCFGMTELGHGSNVMGIETTVSTAGTRFPGYRGFRETPDAETKTVCRIFQGPDCM